MVTSNNNGYAIFDKESLELLEYSDKGKSPYEKVKSTDSYYAGPINYYKKKDNKIQNIRTGQEIKEERCVEIANGVKNKIRQDRLEKEQKEKEKVTHEEIQEEIVSASSLFGNSNIKLMSAPSEGDLIDADEYNKVSRTYIDYHRFFINYNQIGKNEGDSCTTVATQMLLAYNNWINDGRIIPHASQLNANKAEGEEREIFLLYETQERTEEALQELLCRRYEPEVKGTSSLVINTDNTVTFYETLSEYIHEENGADFGYAKTGIENYLKDYAPNVAQSVIIENAGHSWNIESKKEETRQRILSEIDNNRPVLVGLDIAVNDEEEGHAVIAYGYQSNLIDEEIVNGIIVHCGWKEGDPTNEISTTNSNSHVWLNLNWVYAFLSFQTTHLHSNEIPYINGNTHILQCTTCGRIRANEEHTYGNFRRILNEGDFLYHNYHRGTCACGAEAKVLHDIIYTNINDAQVHRVSCTKCSYFFTQTHTMKASSYCAVCKYSVAG